LSTVHGLLDRAAKRHVLHGGTVSRLKSRLAQHINRLAG
jgi:ribosomal protein S20